MAILRWQIELVGHDSYKLALFWGFQNLQNLAFNCLRYAPASDIFVLSEPLNKSPVIIVVKVSKQPVAKEVMWINTLHNFQLDWELGWPMFVWYY